jgi:hypothetical protein
MSRPVRHLAAHTAVLAFIVVFGVIKAATNYFAGRLSDQHAQTKGAMS